MKTVLKPIAALALLASTTPASAQSVAAAPSDDAAELTEAHEIISIMFPPAQRQGMMDKMVSDLMAPMRQNLLVQDVSDPGLKALISEFFDTSLKRQLPLMQAHLPKMLDAMAVAYTHEFSLAELKDIHTFASSSSGSHYLSKSIAIVSDPAVMKVNGEMMAEAQRQSKELIAEFQKKLMAYMEAHPEVAEELAAKAKSGKAIAN
jgi:hypothetical protein